MTDTTPAAPLLKDIRHLGTLLIVTGLIGIVAGVLAIVYPDITLLALALIGGINLMILGALGIADAFAGGQDTVVRVLSAVVGLLGIIAGIVLIRRPGESLLAILVVIGIWLIVSGLVDFVHAFAHIEDRALRMLGAIADIVLGLLILSLPHLSLKTLAVLVGIAFIIRGGVAVVRGFALRRAVPSSPPAGAVTA
jgi:uncharacterized membrane protein HdeD (DUF308 family)